MARSVQVLSLFSRVSALKVIPLVSANSCRFVSGGASKSRRGQNYARRDRPSDRPSYMDDESDEELELEDAEDRVQALLE